MLLKVQRYLLYLTAAPPHQVQRPGWDPCPLDRHHATTTTLPVLEGLCQRNHDPTSMVHQAALRIRTTQAVHIGQSNSCARPISLALLHAHLLKYLIRSICRPSAASGALTMNCWIKQP